MRRLVPFFTLSALLASCGSREPSPAPTSPAPEVILDVTDFGAQGTAAVDDGPALQAALDNAGQLQTPVVVYLPPGSYRIDGGLLISWSHVTLRGAGRGTTRLLTALPGFNLVTIRDARSVTIEDVTIEGWQKGIAGSTAGDGRAVFIDSRTPDAAADVTIRRCDILDINTTAIVAQLASGLTVSDCEIWNVKTAVKLAGVQGALVTGNLLHDLYGDGVYVRQHPEGGTAVRGAARITIRSNTILDFSDTAIDIAVADTLDDGIDILAEDIEVVDNRVDGSIPDPNNLSGAVDLDPNGLAIQVGRDTRRFRVMRNMVLNVGQGLSSDGRQGVIADNSLHFLGNGNSWEALLVKDRYSNPPDYDTFDQFAVSVGGQDVKVRGNSIRSPARIRVPDGWSPATPQIRTFGMRIYGSGITITGNSLALATDRRPDSSLVIEPGNVRNYGIRASRNASAVSISGNALHAMPGSALESLLESGAPSGVVQSDNTLLIEGVVETPVVGF